MRLNLAKIAEDHGYKPPVLPPRQSAMEFKLVDRQVRQMLEEFFLQLVLSPEPTETLKIPDIPISEEPEAPTLFGLCRKDGLELGIRQRDHFLSYFETDRVDEGWENYHRKTEDPHRGRGITRTFLEWQEVIVRTLAFREQKAQRQWCESYQLDVVAFFLNRGYALSDPSRLAKVLEAKDSQFSLGNHFEDSSMHHWSMFHGGKVYNVTLEKWIPVPNSLQELQKLNKTG